MKYKNLSFFLLSIVFISFILLPSMVSAGWTTQTVDGTSSAVGQHTSIATDSNNKVHISYFDIGKNDLRYATNASGSWVKTTIDSTGAVGQYTSIAIDSSDKVHISYFDIGKNDLRYATNASGSWETFKIDETGAVGLYTSIAIDSSDKVHISYYDATNQRLKYATKAPSSISWDIKTIDDTASVGLYTSIAIDSGDKVHISYYDATNRDLKYITNATASGAWQTPVTVDSTGFVGQYTSIAIDSSDKVHISYYDATFRDLRYATNATGIWQIISFKNVFSILGDIGQYSSIAIDQSDGVHISYFDATNFDLKYITNATTSGAWQAPVTVDSTGFVGQYTSVAVDSDYTIHISYYDATKYDLKYAENVGTPDISSTPPSRNFGNVNVGTSSTPRTFTINNNGTAKLVIGTITLTGTNASEYSITEDNCSSQTIKPFSNCTVKAMFSPSSIGTKSAYLSIPSNDPDRATLNVSLSGKGVVQYTLTVSKTGTGDGTVKSSPLGINCGTTCSAPFTSGTRVILTPTVPVESLFTDWTGCDSRSGTRCYITMNSDKTVNADFFLQTFLITLLNPPDTTDFDTCSLYSLPAFQWTTSGTYRSLEIQFSDDGFVTIPVRVRLRPGVIDYTMTFPVWRRVLLIPGTVGGTVLWRVVGTRLDNSKIESGVFLLVVKAPEAVGSPSISHTSRTTPPPPTLSWQNNCNKRFRVWFGNNSDFTAVGVRKMALSFSVTDPTAGGGIFSKELTSSKWLSIRRLVGDVTGATIYWYMESWDGANRYSKTTVTSFNLTP